MASPGIAINRKLFFQVICYLALIWFSWLMLLITIQYIPANSDVAFLRIKQDEIKQLHYQVAFFTHVYTCIFVLLIGLFQFSHYVRTHFSRIHRTLGKAYVSLVLLLAGPTGLIMGYYANGGLISQIAFCLLAVLWMVFTYKAFVFAREGNWMQHRNFMYRSYALTLSAISLRLFKWIIATVFELPPMDIYVIVAWAGWVVNLAVIEAIIHVRGTSRNLQTIGT